MSLRIIRLAAACLAAQFAVPAAAQPVSHETVRELDLSLEGAGHVRIEQLAGPVSVDSHDGDTVTVRMVMHAEGKTADQARGRAEAFKLEHGREGNALWLRARPPLDEHRTLIYAPPGEGAGYNRDTQFAGQQVTIRGRTRWGQQGLPAHVALHVSLPRGTGLDLIQHAGPVTVDGLTGPVRLNLQDNPARVEAVEAPLEIDSGNGRVEVLRHRGPARIESGSAAMSLEDVLGGPMELRSSSGRIRLTDVSGPLTVESGSGGLQATRFEAGERLAVESGSGDVRIQGRLAAARNLEVTTGGGDILLEPADGPDARISIESVGGDITVDLPGLSRVRDHRTRFTAIAGEGRGQWRVESRMGRVRIVSDPGLTGNDDLFGDG